MNSRLKSIAIIIIISFIAGSVSCLLAQQAGSGTSSNALSLPEEKKLNQLQKEARQYRAQGFQLQCIGNLDEALTFYNKAVELDPGYAVAYNDLGVLYESEGQIERAKDCYLRALKIDPNYLSPYTNLAFFYERKKDLRQALFYWQKRLSLGLSQDPWTDNAKKHVENLNLMLSDKAIEAEQALSEKYFNKAKQSYYKGDYTQALKEATDAQQLDPANKEIESLIEKIQFTSSPK